MKRRRPVAKKNADDEDATTVPAGPAWRWVAGVGVVVFLVHVRALFGDLVYDARFQIGEDDFIHTPANLIDVVTGRVLARDVLDHNRPVHLLSLLLDGLVWGRRPFGFHLTSVLLHVANAVLLMRLLVRWLAAPAIAAFATLLFAVHPIVTETVAEPSYREDLLVGLFVLLALGALEAWLAATGARRRLWALAIVAAALGAVGSKESGVAVVPVLLAAGWWRAPREERARLAGVLAAAAVVVGGFVVARFALAPHPSEIFPTPPGRLGGTLTGTLTVQLRIFGLYLLNLVRPTALSADYTPQSLAGISPALSAVALALVVAAHVLLAWRSPAGRVFVVWFWAAFLPVANLIPMYRPAADRYLYVPLMAVGGAAAVAIVGPWFGRVPKIARQPFAVVTAGMLLLAFAIFTIQRHRIFTSDLALWQATVRTSPGSFTAHDNLGWALLDAGRPAEAVPHFSRAMAVSGGDPDPTVGLALALAALDRPNEATTQLTTAIARDPIYGDPHRLRRTMRMTRAQIARLEPLLAKLPR